MPNLFRSREGALTAVDTKVQLTTNGSQTAPGALLVPGESKFLRALWIAGISSNEAADQYGYIVRIEGPGISRGVFSCAGGAGGGPVATGGHSAVQTTRVPVNIAVIPGQEILVFAEAVGDDMGTYQIGVTCEFGAEVGPEGEIKGEITVEGDVTAVDTLTRLTSQGSVPAPSRLVPPDATLLKRVVCAVSADGVADGEVSYLLRLSGDAIRGGEQTLVIGAQARIAVQTGSDASHVAFGPNILDNLDLAVTPNETLDVAVEMCGVDVGSATAVVTVMFA